MFNKSIKLSDKGASTRVELLRVGQFKSPQYGDINVTPEILLSLKKNFDDKVRGYEDGKLPIDYFHDNDKFAAGWINSLEVSGDTLLADVSWTPKAEGIITAGEVRYLSAEFSFNYTSNEDGKSYGPTLMGAGLTNRPFVKKMKPVVSLSEESFEEIKLAVAVSQAALIESGNDEKTALALALVKCGEERFKKLSEGKSMTLEQAMAKIAELQAELEKLKGPKPSPEVQASSPEMKQLEEKVACAEKALAEEKNKNKFNAMLSEGKVVEAQREAFMKNDMIKFSELSMAVNKTATGDDTKSKDESGSAEDKVMSLAEKKMKEDKISFSEAVQSVLLSDSALRSKYEKETKV